MGGTVPIAVIALRAARGTLGANPVAEALNELGLVALIFLLGSLAMTPLQALFRWNWALRVRRMVGVLAFSYATLHLSTYAVVDQEVDLGAILGDIAQRPFIFVGFAAWLLILPLAVTSTDAIVRRLGFARWKRLHRLAYLAGALGVVHFFLRVKRDVSEPVVYGILLAIAFAIRLGAYVRKRSVRRLRDAARQT